VTRLSRLFPALCPLFNRFLHLGEDGVGRRRLGTSPTEAQAGWTLATMLVGLATRIAAKVAAYTYGLHVNRLLGRPKARIKELWA